ncbi:hypothetical protein BAUCODRAFT_148802 [Baudoinia panamericana UAMH 10762]|uniref:NADP-dependent oxidoreductase domain-containing protein n=1 Tax=Baudoinia panamericana (strain UAMH 10762) TaxID=717646 RepID=M2LNM3_BAUPA|nr:uncharacterized protein BAUCODRAFT_148802 [Baudoinia panamericana UAMH 10762]EMC95952.1 hypothetical protein BAUCODRAFT_148802 [Baudoinia panamericana UAMH 10762]
MSSEAPPKTMADNANLKVVLGTMTIAKKDTLYDRISSPSEAAQLLDLCAQHHVSELDTARVYGWGTSEEMLGELRYEERGFSVSTKLFPSKGFPGIKPHMVYTHRPEDLRKGLMDSLKALGAKKVDIFYLHAPDRKHASFEETLKGVNELYEEGLFERFGLSNFMSWEVSHIHSLCTAHSWIRPSVYQGVYSLLQRRVEDELIPCLRHHGIAFYVYSPLAGGLLTGKYRQEQTEFEEGGRFDKKKIVGQHNHVKYWRGEVFEALEKIREVASKHDLTVAETAMRWLKWHSVLDSGKGDAVIVGASSAKHLEENLGDLEKGPLPVEVVEVVAGVWEGVKGKGDKYWA